MFKQKSCGMTISQVNVNIRNSSYVIGDMMNYADASLDALGVFYHEFVKYSGGDGKGLGIVLTPQHLTEFMCELAGVNKNSKVVDIINRLKEYNINPIVCDKWADSEVAKKEYGVDLVDFDKLPKADCIIVAVGHNEYRSLSMSQLKELFKESPDEEKILVDVKSLYRMDELKASGMRFWRL